MMGGPADGDTGGAAPSASLLPTQAAALDRRLGGYEVVADLSWPVQGTTVLDVRAGRDRLIVKAATSPWSAHHLGREIRAHQEVLPRLGDGFPRVHHADPEVGLLVTHRLPGTLAQGSPWEGDADVFRRAGRLLARLHGAAPPVVDTEHEARVAARLDRDLTEARDLLPKRDHRGAVELLAALTPGPVLLVPTHGDLQPRNWLVDPDRRDHDGVPAVALIDFGRYDRRPWFSDLVRLHHQVPTVQVAALRDGLDVVADWPSGDADRGSWLLENLLQSVRTVIWATGVGDLPFADQGRAMLRRTLAEW
ncbi:MAG: aminoglycoside phosphotransferase family protein [Actinotalea sp.]|nr:aminoglycoside phosphotransferase family protein [Actinotalea sp.]